MLTELCQSLCCDHCPGSPAQCSDILWVKNLFLRSSLNIPSHIAKRIVMVKNWDWWCDTFHTAVAQDYCDEIKVFSKHRWSVSPQHITLKAVMSHVCKMLPWILELLQTGVSPSERTWKLLQQRYDKRTDRRRTKFISWHISLSWSYDARVDHALNISCFLEREEKVDVILTHTGNVYAQGKGDMQYLNFCLAVLLYSYYSVFSCVTRENVFGFRVNRAILNKECFFLGLGILGSRSKYLCYRKKIMCLRLSAVLCPSTLPAVNIFCIWNSRYQSDSLEIILVSWNFQPVLSEGTGSHDQKMIPVLKFCNLVFSHLLFVLSGGRNN